MTRPRPNLCRNPCFPAGDMVEFGRKQTAEATPAPCCITAGAEVSCGWHGDEGTAGLKQGVHPAESVGRLSPRIVRGEQHNRNSVLPVSWQYPDCCHGGILPPYQSLSRTVCSLFPSDSQSRAGTFWGRHPDADGGPERRGTAFRECERRRSRLDTVPGPGPGLLSGGILRFFFFSLPVCFARFNAGWTGQN